MFDSLHYIWRCLNTRPNLANVNAWKKKPLRDPYIFSQKPIRIPVKAQCTKKTYVIPIFDHHCIVSMIYSAKFTKCLVIYIVAVNGMRAC